MTRTHAYIVITLSKEGKYFSYADALSSSSDLLSQLERRDIYGVHLCESKKAAKELAEFWNGCFKNNGTYSLECWN